MFLISYKCVQFQIYILRFFDPRGPFLERSDNIPAQKDVLFTF